jgi:hypothetical protein
LEKRNPRAAEAVKFCAYLHPEGIESHFLQQALGISKLELDECMEAIRDYGLLTQEGNHFKMHRLVQEAIHHQKPIKDEIRNFLKQFEQKKRSRPWFACKKYIGISLILLLISAGAVSGINCLIPYIFPPNTKPTKTKQSKQKPFQSGLHSELLPSNSAQFCVPDFKSGQLLIHLIPN